MNIKKFIEILTGRVPFGLRSVIKNIPGLKQLQSALLRKWIDGEEFVATITGGPAKGLVFPVQMPQDKLMWIGTWELEFANALYKNVQPGMVCYDIGGYKGYYAGIMALKGASKVFVFEPMPANANKLKHLIELNKNLPIQLKQLAASNAKGKAVFKVMPEETMGKLVSSAFRRNDTSIGEIMVDCITLDELTRAGVPEPDFIKIDVEGAEEFVLKGAMDLLERKKPFLMIEIHSKEIGNRCLALLKKFYLNVLVLETGFPPGPASPEICHYIAS